MKRRGAGTIGSKDVGQRVKLQGWVFRRRDLGGVIFLQLRDHSGIVQVVVRPEERPQVARALASVRLEWVLEVEGLVAERSAETINPEMPTGEFEVLLDRAEVLAQSEPLPFTVDGKADATEETRLRYRFLDLRRRELQENLILRHKVTLEILKHFDERGFVHVETPILTRSTPEGARDYLVPSRLKKGAFYALPQSPQLFKQILMVSGLDRYVQIARCFRDEDLRADRQPEFTQVDVEMSFPSEEEIFELIESLYARIFPMVGIEPALPFPRLTYEEAMRRFGTDRPDLRFGLEISDLTEVVRHSDFRVFRQTAQAGGVVRAIVIPGGAAASRRQVDGWSERARAEGAAGVLTCKRKDGVLTFQVKNVLSESELSGLSERLELEDGDLPAPGSGQAV
jgi:aspartyl-tRNA synthetase